MTDAEINNLVATKIFGARVTFYVKPYSSSIEEAWGVVNTMIKREYWFNGVGETGIVEGEWWAEFGKNDEKHRYIAHSPQAAICLAALTALGVDVE